MFLNLTPYLTWLGIMLTSKPNDLQDRLNVLSQPSTPGVSPVTSTGTTISTPSTTTGVWDLFICSGRPAGRYAHPKDCRKYFVCTGEIQVVRPNLCPRNLYFSPSALLCTLPHDSGCLAMSTTLVASGSTTISSITSGTTYFPSSNSSWLRQIEAANYYRPVTEDRLVIFYDHDVSNAQNILWPLSFIRTMWESIIMMYGSFGFQNRLYVVLRRRQFPDNLSYSSYLDQERGYVNAIEVGSTDWSVESSSNTDLITGNIAEILSRNARGIKYPGPEPFWTDIFVYDLYQRIGRASDRDRWAEQVKQNTEDHIASIPMFSQWYLPIYQMYGGGSVLNRFLILREQYFPKRTGDNHTFARVMNRGEFVHFWSGATGANLTSLASSVFGWTDALSEMYLKARADFNALNY